MTGVTYLYRPFGLLLLILMVIMGSQVALKKPLCINSNAVYKIDRIARQKTESVYNCSQYKNTGFSEFFYENLPALQARILHLDILLGQLGIQTKFIIQIDENLKKNSVALVNGVRIGSDLLNTDQLEKMLIELGLKNKLAIKDRVLTQTLADFILKGTGYQNALSQVWGQSLGQLGFFAKRAFAQKLFRQLSRVHFSETLSTTDKLRQLLEIAGDDVLVKQFNQNLRKAGFISIHDLADYKLDIFIDLKGSDNLLAKLTDLAQNHSLLKIAVKTASGTYLLPSNLKLPQVIERKLFATYRLVFTKEKENNSLIKQYLKTTERLVFIHSDEQLKDLNFRPLFVSGVNDFLLLNKKLNFVQIHLPSFRLKFRDLGKISDYFDFVKNKNLTESEHKALGWTQSKWLKDLNAFKPVANYDVIQYFRVN